MAVILDTEVTVMLSTKVDFNQELIMNWHFSDKAMNTTTSIIREILKMASQPGIINFGGGMPAPELFPNAEVKDAACRAIEKYGPPMMQYSLTQGVPPLREKIAERFSKINDIDVSGDAVQITSGSQQGLDMIGRAFLNPGDYVLTERPTYLGALQAFGFYEVKYCTAELESDGICIEEAEEQIKKYSPKLIYVVPDFQNPAGISMAVEKREALVELSRKYQIPIVEDNPYSELRFSGEAKPSIQSLGGSSVINLGTFSKTISPGLRIGFLVGCPDVMRMIEKVKQGNDLHTNTFTQYVLLEYLESGHLDNFHIDVLRREYGQRRDTMIRTMEKEFPPDVKFTRPTGGLFLWVTLPEHVSTTDMFQKAVDAGVAYVPGKPFYPHGDVDRDFRINFCNATEENIIKGVERLGEVFRLVL